MLKFINLTMVAEKHTSGYKSISFQNDYVNLYRGRVGQRWTLADRGVQKWSENCGTSFMEAY